MSATIGRNFLVQFLQDRDRSLRIAAASKARAHVVMDDMSFAVELKRLAPQATIIHRSYHKEDAEFHAKWTPQQFVDAYLRNVPTGIAIQVGNEPHGYVNLEQLCKWCVELMRIAPSNVQLALPAFGMGHPTEDLAALDELWLAFKRRPNTIYLVHEYANADPATEQGFHIGRYRAAWKRMRELGVPIPRTIVGEYGRDKGGGRRDGYRGVGWTPSRFWVFLRTGMELVYGPDNVDVVVFCEGNGADNMWDSFNIEGELEDEFRVWNEGQPMTQTPAHETFNWGKRNEGGIARMNEPIRKRTAPSTSATIDGVLSDGEEVDAYYASLFVSGGYSWYKVIVGGKERYVAKVENLHFEAPVVPPINEDGLVKLPVADFNATLADMEVIAQRMQAIQNRLDPYVPG